MRGNVFTMSSQRDIRQGNYDSKLGEDAINKKIDFLGEMRCYLGMLRQYNPNYDILDSESHLGIQVRMRSNHKTPGREYIFQVDQNYGLQWITKGVPTKLRASINSSLLHFCVSRRR